MPEETKPDKTFAANFASIPTALVAKVNGDITEDGFFYIGKCIADEIEKAFPDLSVLTEILDFGCGLGRVISQLMPRAPKASFVAFDIDPLMLRWGSHLLAGAPVRFTPTTLDIPDAKFDLATAISVFTHLDVTTDFWLGEVHRLLTNQGVAFLTYHDETLFSEVAQKGHFPQLGKDAVLKDKYVLGEGTAEGGAAMGTFYTTGYWVSLVERYFEVVRAAPRGLFGHQSYTLVKAKPVKIDREAAYKIYAKSLEKDLFELRTKHEVSY